MPRLQYQASTEHEEQERGTVGSNAGNRLKADRVQVDYLSVTTVKEKPRRQTTGTRLRVALGHDDRGPRPPVCAHDPLNDSRALSHQRLVCASHFTSNWRHRRRMFPTFRNYSNTPTLLPLTGSIEHFTRLFCDTLLGDSGSRGTSRRRTAFR